jgi:tetratricopeptide (TPR) repeat protein
MQTKPTQRSRRLPPVAALAALILVAGLSFAGFRWWGARQHAQWLRTAHIEELAKAAPKNMDDPDLFERLGNYATEQENWPRAAKAFQRACELAPDRTAVWVGWARAMYEIGGYRTANTILSDFIQRHPNDGVAHMERAALRRKSRRTEAAWTDADRAASLSPKSGKAWALRGDLCLDQGIANEGERSFIKARELMPNDPWPYVGLYQAYVSQKKLPEALETARVIVQRYPGVKEGKLYLGEALVLNAKDPALFTEARATLLEVIRSHGKDLRTMDRAAAHFLLGKACLGLKNPTEALLFLEQAEKIAPGNPDTLFVLGKTYRQLGQTQKADATMAKHRQVYEDSATLRQFHAKIKDDPDNADIRLEYARWCSKKGLPSNALTEYEEMIERGLMVEVAGQEKAELEANLGNN